MTGPSQLGRYIEWLAAERGVTVSGARELWQWSVADLEGFWASVWDFAGITASRPYQRVLGSRDMPGAQWFPGARLNYAEHMLRGPVDAPVFAGYTGTDDDVAVIAHSQTRAPIELTFARLRDQVAQARVVLRGLGVGPGDRVVAYLPNIPETLVAFLATASLGAVWASCAPEFGARAVVDRFGQLEPSVLLTVGGYMFGAKQIDKRADVAAIRAGLPTVRHVIAVPYGQIEVPDAPAWPQLLAGAAQSSAGELVFEQVAADHPLYVLFSSGTTGIPKAIVHGHGGILVEHVKGHSLHWDLKPGDRMLWFSTTAWMMWNSLVSALLVRASIVMIDGNPMYPDLGFQWRLAQDTGVTLFGASPGYLMASRTAGLAPTAEYDLSRLRTICSAGSPLPVEGYDWVHQQFGADVRLNVGSGGTDVCSGIVQDNPLVDSIAGEMAGPGFGVDAKAFDPAGHEIIGELGELVITSPMPSMPVGLWGDTAGSRYRETYFDTYPGVWRHGDWIRFAADGSCIVTGRSDATLNRGGVRLGTAEFYRVVEELPEIADSLVIHLEDPAGGNGELLLFVVVAEGDQLDEALTARVRGALRSALSPRHVPDSVTAIAAVPRNRTGKKLELPAKRLLRGEPIDAVASRDALADPASLDVFVALGAQRAAGVPA